MKYFVTGASGWIGTPLVQELLGAGHQVAGLARSDASARRLQAAGAGVVRGDLDDPAGLARAAADSDGVVHLAFQHEVAFAGGDFRGAAAADRRAVEAMGGALAGSDRPFVLASGTAGVAVGRTATENDGLMPNERMRTVPAALRQATALLALSLWGTGVRSSVLRFPPTVHGDGDNGFIARLVATARRRGVAGYVGDGANRWPAVHCSDAARAARLALESAPPCSVIHVVGDEGIAMRDVAEAIGRGVAVPAASIAPDDAMEHFGPIGGFVSLDIPASSAITRELLGWQPTGPSLLEDLDQGHYFKR